MKTILSIVSALCCLALAHAGDQRVFSTETSVAFDADSQTCLVIARVSELVEEDGKVVESLISAPRLTAVLGKQASIWDKRPDGLGVRADVFWPESGTDKPASFTITLRFESKVLSRSTFKLNLKKP